MDPLLRDLRLAFRTFFRKPGVTALAVVSLSLAIGFSTAAFSILDAYALRDLPVSDPNRLVNVAAQTREKRGDAISWIEFQAIASRVHAFRGVTVEDRESPAIKLNGRTDRPISGLVSDSYFDVLGVTAAMGDVFHAGKGQPGTIVISHHYWKEKLAGDPGIVGRTLPVQDAVVRIIGVLPPDFTGTNRGLLVETFMPSQTVFGGVGHDTSGDIRYSTYEGVARLRPGATIEQARTECDAVLGQLDRDGRAPGPERRAIVTQFGDGTLLKKLQTNVVLLAVVVLLVLIAAANLANLRLVENEARRHETGIRMALGAGRTELGRQHLTETLLLAGAGTAVGLLLAKWLTRVAAALFYGGKTVFDFGIRVDARSFVFSSAALLLVALVGAAIPLADSWRRRVMPAMQGSRATRPSRWLGALLVTQMALVTGVVCSAGLLWRSLDKLSQIRPAMDPDRRMLLATGMWDLNAAEANVRATALAGGIARLPGVEGVAWARRVMLSGSGGGAVTDVEIAGQPKHTFPYNNVSPGYFTTTGARILSGRAFADADGPDATLVVMVNSLFVRRFFGPRDPLGAWIKVGGQDRQIVGVVEDGPHNHLRETPTPYVYFPFAQRPVSYLTWMIHTRKDPGELAGAFRGFVRSADSGFTLLSIHTLREHMRDARSDQEVGVQVAGALAAVGLLLAAAGLFGVTLFAVAKRTPEFGVRAAMGASPRNLARLVLRDAAIRVAIALPLGWALAYAGKRAIEKLLFGVAPDDPWTFAAASAVVAVVACAAALHPALRAARIDPMTALRHE
jgi:putative ABC transport system permease protein